MVIDYNNLSAVVDGIGPKQALEWLGFSDIREDYSAVRAPCAVHGGDRKDSFCLYKNTLVWRCFSKKCEEVYGKTFFHLVEVMLKCSFSDAVSAFCDRFAVDKSLFCEDDPTNGIIKDMLFMSYLRNSSNDDDDEDLKVKKVMTEPSDYFLSTVGGPFDPETLKFFGAGGKYIDTKSVERIYIPIYNANNVLVGYSGRAPVLNDNDKYSHSWDSSSGKILYNLNNAKDSISDYIIVVEGFKAVWRLYEYGYTNTVCCMGSTLKPKQVELLIKTLRKVILFFDPDPPGVLGMELAIKHYNNIIPMVVVLNELNRDPADLSKEEVDSLLTQYRPGGLVYV